MEQGRDVVGEVEHAVGREVVLQGDASAVQPLACGVVAEVGDELILAYALAVHVELEVAACGDVGLGLPYLALQREGLSA